jgi:hypothetical protein
MYDTESSGSGARQNNTSNCWAELAQWAERLPVGDCVSPRMGKPRSTTHSCDNFVKETAPSM